MIIQEIVNINDLQLRHTYSSNNKYIKQTETGAIYNEAYDTMARNFHYIETDKDLETYVPQDGEEQKTPLVGLYHLTQHNM